MEGQQFDAWTKALAAGQSRRTVLKGLAAGILGSLAGLARSGIASAATTCTSGRQCPSFRCVDGFCCDRACTGQCEACNVPGREGTCSPVSGAPIGNRQACPGSSPCQATCDGVIPTHCAAWPGSEVACGAATCADGFATTYACGGNGNCTPTTTSCGLYLCGPNGCLTGCTSDAECVGAAFCAGGVCQGDGPLGAPCEGPDQCQSGICVDSVCCQTACDGVCQSCNLPGNAGFCTEAADGAACDGGTCCDGECVDTQSNLEHCGGCDQACRLTPTPGSCEGAPVCAVGQCGFTPAPQGTECRPAAGPCDVAEACDGSTLTCPDDVVQPADVVCREATGPCDITETCDGTNANCPADQRQPNDTSCGTDLICCDGSCVDNTTTANCGACGHTCAAGELCCGGACVSAESAEHCGGCGIQCPASQICFNGGCCIIPGPGSTIACTEDSDCCGDEPVCCGTCVFLTTDERHCGGCGIECDTAAHQICFNGGCCGGAGAACTTDADCCITSCVDGTCESFQ